MMHITSDQEARAWYVLGECIARGRKEHALGIYRLLAHRLHDEGAAQHLLADILSTVGDHAAAHALYEQVACNLQS
jgi:hypothetical protein